MIDPMTIVWVGILIVNMLVMFSYKQMRSRLEALESKLRRDQRTHSKREEAH